MSCYKNIFENLPFPCLLFEKKNDVFIISEANTLYCEVTNLNGKELKGKMIEEVFPENPSSSSGLERILKSLETAYKNQKPHKIKILKYDLYNEQNDNYIQKYWEVENIPINDDAKDTRYILNVVKDITAQILEKDRCNMLQVKLDDKIKKHDQIIEKVTDGLFSLDREGSFVSLNKGFIDIAETSESDLYKMNFLPFCSEDHREKILKKFNAAIGGTNQTFEADFISGKGKKMVLEISLVPLRNSKTITGIYGIAKDITRLKESEVAVYRSERKFKALVQEGSDLIGILDLNGKYKFVSETSSSVLGISPKDFIGKTAFDFMHPEDQERVIEEFSGLEFKNQIQIDPFRFKNAKGEWRWVQTKATNLTNDPAVGGIVTNSRDITDQIISQKAIKESEERYRSFFENSLDAVMVTIPDGKILAANPSACRMFQMSEKELCSVGRSAVTDSGDPRLTAALDIRRQTGTTSAELTFVRKDGTKFPGEITSSIFKDPDGNSRSSMIIRDITKRKISEKELLEVNESLRTNTKELIRANKGLEQFSFIISHNLRAPVANILGLTQLLIEESYSNDMKINLRKEVESNAQRMDKVIKDLNQILQLKQDFSEAKQAINFNEIVQFIEISLHDILERENIKIVTNFEEINQVRSVRSFIYSIFYNLIFNSIKYRQPGVDAEIKITSKKENGIISLIFQDNGLGMDSSIKKDDIFSLYKRFHHHIEGKGMGLFMVKTQVEMLGGKINVLSKVNCGSTFIIKFSNKKFKL
ncbi:PAS domain S-box protein [Salinimicrobium sp. TH3]|uniref:PAS domain S-box protein n=1 Tax=Salinimicrobium sp. TH3 TaxID=2997342 RepID=UPI0022759266|nr:PAS domain S-box protein [Salinimicrobium sp. TH3]MCY2687541.1 PAS domain S-box protein [Salinimicrobium sp. TH3]